MIFVKQNIENVKKAELNAESADSAESTLLVLFSYHHNNTEKVAKVIAKILDAQIKSPQEITPEDLPRYDLIGFGSGIYDEKHHQSLLDLADRLPPVSDKKAFLFSTSATKWDVSNKHAALKKKLQAKGYIVVGEFNCKGFNTNSFLRFFGGMNKGRPNAEELDQAIKFARNLK
jgi:flavodoxin